MQRQSSPLGSFRTQNTAFYPLSTSKRLAEIHFLLQEPLMEGPVLGGCARMGRWTKPVPRVSILRHGRNLAGTLLQGGGRLVPSPPGETTMPPPRLSATRPSPEKFHFNHSTLVQYSILRLRNASDKTRFPFKQTRKLNPSWKK